MTTNNKDYSVNFYSSNKEDEVRKLHSNQDIAFVHDIFADCLSELFDIENPSLKSDSMSYRSEKEKYLRMWEAKGSFDDQGSWVYYPWLKTLVHFPNEPEYLKLRASRNRNLITTEEQRVFQSKKVAIAGLSVGSNVLNTLVLISGPRYLKIADHDTISVPNLNRIMAPAHAVGLNKAVFFARRTLEVDPFIKIEVHQEGLDKKNLETFLTNPKVDLFIEEMDNAFLKIESRKIARRAGIPVIMAADNGDGVLVDIERFDIEDDRPLFHGRLDKVIDLNAIKEDLTFPEKMVIIANIVNLEEASSRAQDSLGEVGKTLNTWPQLGTAALMAGVTLSFIARRLLLGLPIASGRYGIQMEDYFVPNFNSKEETEKRKKHTEKVIRDFEALQKQLRGG